MSTQRRTAGVYSRKRPLGPNGEKICYNCGGPLPKGRRFNCSEECSEEWRGKTSPSHMRYLVHKRDHGICALCGLDCDALAAAVEWVRDTFKKHKVFYVQYGQIWNDFLSVIGILNRWPGDLWDADHITPVVEGGGECGLANFRTLCLRCHKRETAELAKRMALARRMEKIQKRPLPLFD
jgi:5-methylcytosine-specific restriction enzyme A